MKPQRMLTVFCNRQRSVSRRGQHLEMWGARAWWSLRLCSNASWNSALLLSRYASLLNSFLIK